jgi:hypothetical protein
LQLALLAAQGGGLGIFGRLVAILAPAPLLGFLDGHQIYSGCRKEPRSAWQKGDLFILNVKGEPPPTDGGNLDGGSLPPAQLAAAVAQHDILVVEFEQYLEFGRGVTIELDAPIERSVFSFSLNL